FRCVAVQFLRTRIPTGDLELQILADDGIFRRCDDCCQLGVKVFGFAEQFILPPQFYQPASPKRNVSVKITELYGIDLQSKPIHTVYTFNNFKHFGLRGKVKVLSQGKFPLEECKYHTIGANAQIAKFGSALIMRKNTNYRTMPRKFAILPLARED